MAEPDSIESLLTETSRAVLVTQRRLDTELSPYYASRCQVAGHAVVYAIPHVSVETEFAIDQRQAGRLLWVFSRDGRREHLTHRLRFRLTAVPERPVPPGTVPAVPLGNAFLSEPHMLLGGEEEAALSKRVAAALEAGTFEFVAPKGSKEDVASVARKEARRIREALTAHDPERGMVGFRLDSPPSTVLLVRVTEKGKHDGVFVVDDLEGRPVRVHSMEDDGAPGIQYEPLHCFARTVRNWQSGAPARRRPVDPGDLTRLGLVGLEDFAAALERGYSATLSFLAAEAAGAASSFYALSDLEADLHFAVHFDEHNALQLEIARRLDPTGEESPAEASVVSCRVELRAHTRDGTSVLDLNLASPEFIVSGAGRDLLLKRIEAGAGEIADALADGGLLPPERYAALLRDRSRARDAVLFLAYEGKKPKQEFLAIWPGSFDGNARDVVFTCRLDNEKIGHVRALMRLEQSVSEVELGIGGEGADLTEDQYTPFHNAFHAVRIWRARMPA